MPPIREMCPQLVLPRHVQLCYLNQIILVCFKLRILIYPLLTLLSAIMNAMVGMTPGSLRTAVTLDEMEM